MGRFCLKAIRHSIGIDVGASNGRIGILDAGGRLLGKRKADIREMKRSSAATMEFISREAEGAVRDAGLRPEDIGFIGLGFPGTVDDARQSILFAPNLGWTDVHIDPYFRAFPAARVALVQDARAAAFAEYLLGAGKGEPVLVCITLGTGIGGGIVIDGRAFHGGLNTAGEIGHMLVQENGLRCACGKSGCLEAYCSGTAIVNAARQLPGVRREGGVSSAEQVFRLARDGDADCLDVIRRCAHYLGIGIVNVVNLFSPTSVVLSGGMCEQEELLIRPVREFVLAHAYSLSVRSPGFRIGKASLGEDSPMIGAGMLYRGG